MGSSSSILLLFLLLLHVLLIVILIIHAHNDTAHTKGASITRSSSPPSEQTDHQRIWQGTGQEHAQHRAKTISWDLINS